MTVSRATTLLFSFRSKIEEAVSLVPRMCPEEKLKAVQFWNIVSEKLQDIVNNSAADINAVALKMGEAESDKLTQDMNSSTLDTVSQNNTLSTEFMNLASNYAISNDSGTQFRSSDISDAHIKQLIPKETPFSNGDGHSTNDELTSSIHHLNEVTDISKKNDQSACDQFLDIANLSSSCDTFSKNVQSVSELPVPSEQMNNYSSDKIETQRKSTRYQPSRKAKKTKCDENFYSDIDVSMDISAVENKKLLKKNRTKASETKNMSAQKKNNCERTVNDYLEDSIDDNHSDFGAIENLEKSNESNSEHVVSFIVSNSEELLEHNNSDQTLENNTQLSASNKPYICKVCKKEFATKLAISSHCCKQEKSFTCLECKSVFTTKGNLIVHMRKHTGEKPYVCPECNASFSTQGNLKRHVNTHSGEKPWKCEECDTCFTEKKSLVVHMRRHTGERPYECKVCGKGFAQSGILRTHMAMHLNLKVHLCELCGKSFRQKSQLRMHKLRHDNVRKFGCNTCSSFFLTKGDLERHSRKHTGEKPFICDVCSKTFTRQQSLNEHLNRHYGIKPYLCKHCGKTFSEMSACYKHIKLHSRVSTTEVEKEQINESNQVNEDHKPHSECVPEAGNTENELPNLDGPQYFTVVINSKGACEVQSENNQTLVFNSSNEENAIVTNGFGVLTAINFSNVSSIPQNF